MMQRLLPSPLMSLFLLAMWLLLNQTLAVGQILLGLSFALVLPALTSKLRPQRMTFRRPLLAARLTVRVALDSVISNIAVARIVLGTKAARDRSGFVKIPLDMRDPYGLAMLCMILTAVPGTVWSELSEDREVLTIHVLDLTDEHVSISTIKDRYEKPLMEIFE